MRHANKIKKLGRTHAHRKATMASLSTALLRHKRITTTLAKAKALRSFVEPVINRAKEDTTTNRRQAFRRLQDKEAVKTLFGEVADALGDRPGGYTRVVKLGQRPGDAAEMAVIELVDFNDVKPEGGSAKKKTRRGGSRRRSKSTAAAPAAPKAEATETDADDLTKLWGVGEVFATALRDAGLDSFDAIAEADLDALRAAIAEGSEVSDEAANEETWAEQARYAAADDWDGLDAYIETLKEEGGTAHTPPEEVPPAEPEAEAEPTADAAAEAETAEPETAAPEDEAAIENPAAPEVAPQANPHPDAEQGAPPGEGPPPPEADPETRGSSEHRG